MPLDGQHVVKIGKSFKNKTKSNLVTFQYDFIPDSVEKEQPGQVTVESDNSISVNLANKSGSYTQFKGTFKESLKDCVLLVNKKTSEMTLERLDYVVNLKNTRTPGSKIKRKSSSAEDLSDSASNESVKQKVNKTNSNQISNDVKCTIKRKSPNTENLSDSSSNESVKQKVNKKNSHQISNDVKCTNTRIKRKSPNTENLSNSSSNESVKQNVNKKCNEIANDSNSKSDVSDDLFGEWDSEEDYKKTRQPSPKKQFNNNIDIFDFPKSAVVNNNNTQPPKTTNQTDLLFGSSNKTNENKPIEIDQSLYNDLELTDSDSDMNDVEGEIDDEKINVVKDDLALSDTSDSNGSSSSSGSGTDSD